jgi:F-type H+-transporting ATPase subunit b
VQFASESAAGAQGAEESAQGIAALGIDPIAIILQAGTFLVLFVLLNKFGLNKIVASLKDRQDTIAEGLKNAHEIEEQKQALIEENEAILKKARKEADAIIGKSHEEAGAIVSEAQARANKQAEEIVAKAKAQTEEDQAKARAALKTEILGLVSAATETILDEKIDDKKDSSLISRAINQAEAN